MENVVSNSTLEEFLLIRIQYAMLYTKNTLHHTAYSKSLALVCFVPIRQLF